MSRSPFTRRTAIVALLAPIVTAGLVATAGPAGAIPFEGDPGPSQCLRLERLPGAALSGSHLFVSNGYVLVISSDC